MEFYKHLKIDSTEIGQVHKNWTQIGPSFSLRVGTERRRRRWAVCQCRCGAIQVVRYCGRGSGPSGCIRCYPRKLSDARVDSIPGYYSWKKIHARCYNPKSSGYKNYGGRGISVCERWKCFENFIADMGPRPRPGMSIERVDNNGDYCPSNCRWATITDQQRNKRTNLYYTFRGRRMLLQDIASEIGMNKTTLYQRVVVRKWELGKATEIPAGTPRGRHATQTLACTTVKH